MLSQQVEATMVTSAVMLVENHGLGGNGGEGTGTYKAEKIGHASERR